MDDCWPIIIIGPSQMTFRDILTAPPFTSALNASRQQRLTSLAWSIPCSSLKTAQCVFMLSQYALGVDYVNHGLFCSSIKGKKAIAERKSEARSGALTLTGKEEPFEQFLIKALATGKSWEELIHENRISKTFIHIESLWQHREYFIMYICDAYFPKEEARYLAFRCIFRTSESIASKMLVVRDSHYYKSRLDAWISKETHEIDRLEDRLLSLLIQSVKRELTLTATLHHLKEHLDFQWINKFCELHWLNFLCCKFQSVQDKQIFKTCELRRKITWRRFDRNEKVHYNGEVVYRLNKRLQNCLKNYVCFDQYFVDELEVMLLNSFREKIPWSEVKIKINALFTEVNDSNEAQNIDVAKNLKKRIPKAQRCQQLESDELYQENIQGRRRKNQGKSVNKYVEIGSTNFHKLDPSNQQLQTLSLIQKTQDCYDSVKIDYFRNLPNDALVHFVASNRREMESLAQQKLAYYRDCPQKIDQIQHQGTKRLLMSLLAFEAKPEPSQESINRSSGDCSFIKQEIEQTKEDSACSEQFEQNSDHPQQTVNTFSSIEYQD